MKKKNASGQKHPVISAIGAILMLIGIVLIFTSGSGKKTENSNNKVSSPIPEGISRDGMVSIVKYDFLGGIFATINQNTTQDDLCALIDRYDIKKTIKDYDEHTRLKMAYQKEVSLHEYPDFGSYIDAYFNSSSGVIEHTTYFNHSREKYVIYYLNGDYNGLALEETGFYSKTMGEDPVFCTDIETAMAAVFNIDLTDTTEADARNAIKDWLIAKIEKDVDKTNIDAYSTVPYLGQKIADCCEVHLDLTWNVRNNRDLTGDMLVYYGDEIAYNLGLEFMNIKKMDIYWVVPYQKYMTMHLSYEQKQGRMKRVIK